MKVLMLGIGNLLMTDDGIGVRVIQELTERYRFPDEVTVLEGGTLGLDLLPQVQAAERLLVIDAVETGESPGTIVRFTGGDIPLTYDSKLSPHQIGLQDLLAVAEVLGGSPIETVIWGVQPASLTVGIELSPPVAARLEPLIEEVLEELAGWGVHPLPAQEAGWRTAESTLPRWE